MKRYKMPHRPWPGLAMPARSGAKDHPGQHAAKRLARTIPTPRLHEWDRGAMTMARVTGCAQCGKCGTWRKRGIELLTHMQMGRDFRCPGCGRPRGQHEEHYCTAADYEAAKKRGEQLTLV